MRTLIYTGKDEGAILMKEENAQKGGLAKLSRKEPADILD